MYLMQAELILSDITWGDGVFWASQTSYTLSTLAPVCVQARYIRVSFIREVRLK